MKELLEKCLKEFQYIQGSYKGSMGSIHNTYLPQIDRGQLDLLVNEIKHCLQQANEGDRATECGYYTNIHCLVRLENCNKGCPRYTPYS